MKKYLVILILTIQSVSYSQKTTEELIDSLNFAKTHQEKSLLSLKIAFILKDYDWKRALKYLENSEKEVRLSKNIDSSMAIHNKLVADIYYDKEVLDVALEFYQKTYNYYLKTTDLSKIYKIENDLAIIYARLNDNKKAIHYFNRIYAYQSKRKDSVQLVKILNNLGTIYLKKNLDSSEYYYTKALKITSRLNNLKLNAYVYTNLGRIFQKKNNLEKSKYYFLKSKDLTNKQLDSNLKSFIFQSISKYYFKIKKYDSAIYYSRQSNDLLNNKNSFIYLENLKTLYQSNIAKKLFKEASDYFEPYNLIRDSLNVAEKLVNIERLKLKQEYKLKSQSQQIKEEKKQVKYFLIGLILFIGLLFLIIILIHYRNRLLKSKLEKEGIESKRKELNFKLALKEKLLIAKSMSEIYQNEVTEEILSELTLIKNKAVKKETKMAIDRISKKLKKDTRKKIWNEFELTFKQVHQEFYTNLYRKHPELTARDKRLCALLILNLSTKEIAQITGETHKTVENSRTRLRKKLNITNTKTNLTAYLSEFN